MRTLFTINIRKMVVGRICESNSSAALAFGRIYRGLKSVRARISCAQTTDRERLVILGSGWASAKMLKQLDPMKYDAVVVSPRPWFVMTPLLPTAISGHLRLRTLIEPFTHFLKFGGRMGVKFIKGEAVDLIVNENKLIYSDDSGETKTVDYNKLVIGVGCETATFGIPGVLENASFLKEIEDVAEIRRKIFSAFDAASANGLSEAEKRKLLNIVVVGAGPAGVEAAAEISDLINHEMKSQYPSEAKLAQVNIIEMLPGLIPMFGKTISNYAGSEFDRQQIKKYMEHRVVRITADSVEMLDKDNAKHIIPSKVIIWTSGIAQVPFSRKVMGHIPEQNKNRVLRVSPDLKVIGTDNVYAVGDCSFLTHRRLADDADRLYERALSSMHGPTRGFLNSVADELVRSDNYVQLHWRYREKALSAVSTSPMTLEEFKDALTAIDAAYSPPPPTAQMAAQAGSYLGSTLNRLRKNSLGLPLTPFAPYNYGAMSYVGDGNAIVEYNAPGPVTNILKFVPVIKTVVDSKTRQIRVLGGLGSSAVWQFYYWSQQNSIYNKVQSIIDSAKARFGGTDTVERTLASSVMKIRDRENC